MDWIIKELATLSFGDKRLKKRAEKILEKLSRNATDSIPAACRSAAETKAAYRFFDNDQVTPEMIQKTHFDATLARMNQYPVVLIPQDTTKGMHLHCAIAVTPEKICLGSLSVKQWHREELQKLIKKKKIRKIILLL